MTKLMRNVVCVFQGYHYCPGQHIANVTTDEMTDYTHRPLLFHLGRDPGEKFFMEYVHAPKLHVLTSESFKLKIGCYAVHSCYRDLGIT